MSPRKFDPDVRVALVEAAARLLHESGPTALTVRRVTTEVGCSTMAVYSRFGGMDGLVRAVVHEGFARLQRHFDRVCESIDPVADMALLGRAYRRNALANPHLYAVMFGAASLSGFELSEADRQYGRYTLVGVAACAERCLRAGRFTGNDPELVAHLMWTAVHGLVTLELGEYLIAPYDANGCFEAQLASLMVAAGDRPEDAERSVQLSRARLSLAMADRAARAQTEFF